VQPYQLPTFEDNIKRPIFKAIDDNRSFDDICGIIDEIKMFACPVCGHTMPDHSWIHEQAECLVPECSCEGPDFVEFDDAELTAQIDAIIRGEAV
jgi:NAD-dependent SIR2 family protein deacetylase